MANTTELSPIKWTGSKRYLAKTIVSYINNDGSMFTSYYEPFVGGGNVLLELLKLENHLKKAKRFYKYYASDINSDLIDLWNLIKSDYRQLYEDYSIMWKKFNSKDLEYRKYYFLDKRNEYNTTHNVSIFFFLLRTCYNGLVRYNKNGEFNSSCHFTRPGMNPKEIFDILIRTSVMLNMGDVSFICRDYRDDTGYCPEDTFMYFDPPYIGDSVLYGAYKFDINEFFDYLRNLNCNYIFTLNAKTDKHDYEIRVPSDLYTDKILVESGNSSFRRLLHNENTNVSEYMYLCLNKNKGIEYGIKKFIKKFV